MKASTALCALRQLVLVVLSFVPLVGQVYPGPLPIEMSSGKSGLVRKGLVAGYDLKSVNLLKYSEAASSTNWGGAFSATATQNTAISPDGTTTADTIAFAANTNYAYTKYYRASSIQGQAYTCSMWIWSPTKTDISLRITASPTGEDSTFSQILITSTPTRYYISRTFTSTDQYIECGLDNRGDAFGDGAFSAGDVVVWGIQLNEGSTALPYVATTDLQTVPNMVAGGAALTLGSTSDADASDPTRTLSGMVFDGTGDYLTAGDKFDILGSFTLIAVFKSNDTSSLRTIVGKTGLGGANNKDYDILTGYPAPGALTGRITSGDINETIGGTVDTAWHDVVLVGKVGDKLRVFKDAEGLSASTVDVVPPGDSAYSFIVGCSSLASYCHSGAISYVLIYNRALSPKEIRQNHQWLKGEMAKGGVSLP